MCSRDVFCALAADVIQRTQETRKVFNAILVGFIGFIRLCQFVKSPYLPITDDAVHIYLQAALFIVPLAGYHLCEALHTPFFKIVPFRLCDAEQGGRLNRPCGAR